LLFHPLDERSPTSKEDEAMMTTTFADPMAAMVGSHAFSLLGLASPFAGDLSWVAPLAFAAAVAMVVLVARGVSRDHGRNETPAAEPTELRRAA
jgi:hypothetical protein